MPPGIITSIYTPTLNSGGVKCNFTRTKSLHVTRLVAAYKQKHLHETLVRILSRGFSVQRFTVST